jgi:hypothetical protein
MRLLLGSVLILIASCGDSRTRPPPIPPGDGGTEPIIALTLELIEPESPLRLTANESVALRFRVYSTTENEPEAGVVITCSTAGVSGDAALPNSATTDEAGEATFELSAGVEPAFLRIRCATPRASEIELHAAISPSGGFGVLLVEPSYAGARATERVRVSVYYGLGCQSVLQQSAHMTSESALESPARVDPVPVELEPTLVVELVDSSGRPLARGCLDGVTASPGEELSIIVPVEDLPLQIAGEYPATLQIRTSSAPSFASAAGQTAAFAELGAFGDDVDYMLAMLRMELVARAFEVDLVTLEQDLSDNYAIELAEAYAIDGNTPSDIVAELAALTLNQSGALVLDGALSIVESGSGTGYELGFVTESIQAGASFDVVSPIPLSEFFGDARGSGLSGPLLPGGFLQGELGFGFGGGSISAAGLLASLDPATSDSLLNAFGCQTFAQLPSFEVTFLECEDACRLEVCEMAFERVLGAFISAVEDVGAGSSLALDLDLRFVDDGTSVIPASVSVEHALARLMDGAMLFEVLETELVLAP